MIERYTFVKLQDKHLGERAEIAQQMQWTATALPGVLDAQVGLPADDSAARWDLSMRIRCEDLATWQTVAASEVFVELP